MHDPRQPHFQALKRILSYLQGTLDHGLFLLASPITGLTAYSDADWAGCPDSCRSTSGYCAFLGNNLISWSSKHQATVSRSVLKPNIEVFPMLLRRLAGYATCYLSFISLYVVLLWYIVTISVRCTCLATQYNISAPNTLKLISIFCMNVFVLEIFEFFTFLLNTNMLISSLGAFLVSCSSVFVLV